MGRPGKNLKNSKSRQPLHFANKLIASIPHGRKGRHSEIVSKIISDLERLAPETAILVPVADLKGVKMENV